MCTAIMRHTYEILLGSYAGSSNIIRSYISYMYAGCVRSVRFPVSQSGSLTLISYFLFSGANQRPRADVSILEWDTHVYIFFFYVFFLYILIALFLTNLNSSSDTFALADRAVGSAMWLTCGVTNKQQQQQQRHHHFCALAYYAATDLLITGNQHLYL